MITKEMAMSLTSGTILHHKTLKGADGTPIRARVNGKCQTWKTRPCEFMLPMKHGLYDYFYISETNNHIWELPND